ncbi:TIGR03621 family F420-dependent LLM class oxidoreductase [Actinomadura fulvescens]|uniref:LLM class F420-dependent oxidoreductase n=1 Tax=Actinomadura fulvescens TaxID=46160 RepID=A0ABN3PHS4_9ACTN
MGPFRFGMIGTKLESGRAWAEKARWAEETGFATFVVGDHFQLPAAPVPAMLAAAHATTTLRVGCQVLANDFRHPAVLAKEIATLDVLTGGRVELGLGAGWMRAEYEMAGIGFDDGGTRVDRLAEAVTILRALLTTAEPVSFTGRWYRVNGLVGLPRPVQRPIPLQIGGGGRSILRLAAEHASIAGLVPRTRRGELDPQNMSERATEQRVGWLREAAGERMPTLELHAVVLAARVTGHRRRAAEEMAALQRVEPEVILDNVHIMVGPLTYVRERLEHLREAFGISYFSFFDYDAPSVAPVVAELAGR